MSEINLSRFAGIDPARLTPSQLDDLRYAFAAIVTEYAATCPSNYELLRTIINASSPYDGLPFPAILGEGSTRRTWSLPFGLALKLERGDELTAEEMTVRGSAAYLRMRRRTANFREALVATQHPQLVPRMYGILFGFGRNPPNPNLLIVEALPTLDRGRPNDTVGISNDCLFKCSTTSRLIIVDPRFPTRDTPKEDDLPLSKVFPGPEPGTWLGNIGVDSNGGYYLTDSGNARFLILDMDEQTFVPTLPEWIHCYESSAMFLEQTRSLSRGVFNLYRRALAASSPTRLSVDEPDNTNCTQKEQQ
ncbi:MAG: hypothetical protein JWM43_3910 [Acidobacteriaceae bacterium]|nr:hypothetical protein [Acidobacteriaceae bacterium]